MAIYYHRSYSKARGTSNFGDDINPFLLGRLFDESIIKSEDVCIIGIGTILNDRELSRVDGYKRKIVFSSGVGYGSLDLSRFDESWDFSCVRGPKSASALGLTPEVAIADAGLLIPELMGISSHDVGKKYEITFIPHAESDMASGSGLKAICDSLHINYLSPRVQAKEFVSQIAKTLKVITEAMHGAIIADSVRVPWVPVKFHVHEPFKWSDWCESVELRYQIHDLNPVFWEDRDGSFSILKKGWQRLKCNRFKHRLAEVSKSVDPILSKNSVSENRRQALSKIAQQVNERYVKVGCD